MGRRLLYTSASFSRQADFASQKSYVCAVAHITKSACPTAAKKAFCCHTLPHRRVCRQPLSRVSRKQRYNTLDFPRESRVPRKALPSFGNLPPRERCSPLDSLCQQGCYSPLLDDPEPKELCPSGHLACPCSGYPSCSCTMVPPYPNRKDQARKSTQNKGEFPCLVHCL